MPSPCDLGCIPRAAGASTIDRLFPKSVNPNTEQVKQAGSEHAAPVAVLLPLGPQQERKLVPCSREAGKKPVTGTNALDGGSSQPSKSWCDPQRAPAQQNCLSTSAGETGRLTHAGILLRRNSHAAGAGGPTLDARAGAANAAGALTNRRKPLQRFVDVSVLVAAEAGGAGAAGSSSPRVDERCKPKQRVTPCPHAPRWQQGLRISEGLERCPQLIPVCSRAGFAGSNSFNF